MTAKSETVGVAYGVELCATTFGSRYWTTTRPLDQISLGKYVPESALAGMQRQRAFYYDAVVACGELRQSLIAGLEALAGRMDKRDEWMRTKSAPNIGLADAFKNAAEDIRALIPAAANTESEEGHGVG